MTRATVFPMNDVVLGLVAILIGTVFCFRGYFAMRIIIPIWGAFAGFVLGAGLVSVGDGEFLSTVLSWIVGLAVALVFGLIAYLYYEVAVFIGMTSIGFVLGTTVMAALGVTWSWLVILVGVITAAVLALIAIVGDMPMVLLTLLTALAGADRDHRRADAHVRGDRHRRLRFVGHHRIGHRRLVVVRHLRRPRHRRHHQPTPRERSAAGLPASGVERRRLRHRQPLSTPQGSGTERCRSRVRTATRAARRPWTTTKNQASSRPPSFE